MKIKSLSFILLALLCVFFAACGEDDVTAEDEYYSVTFEYNNGTPSHTVRAEADKPMAQPKNPEKEGYIFGGWRGDSGEWRFTEDLVYKDMTLSAIWIDASSIFDYAVTDDGTIKITNYSGSLKEIGIPEVISGYTVSALADNLFSETDKGKISAISLPSTITSVGEYALEGCKDIPIAFSGSLSYIGESAFASCTRLSSVKLSEGLVNIPYNAFASCSSLGELEIPASVEVIEENAFYGCSSIKTVIINSKDIVIENGAFSGCDGLLSVFFAGSEEEWNTLLERVDNGGGENSSLISAKVFFLSEAEPEGDGNYWHRTDGGEARVW